MDSQTPQYNPRGIFVTFEGPECSGKSTQLSRLGTRLRGEGHEVVDTREPGGSRFGQQIRMILLHPEYNPADVSELLLFYADRSTHLQHLIIPALERGAVVLCDRFYDSTKAYQHYGRGLSMDLIRPIHDVAVGAFKPDLTLLYDAPVDELLKRKYGRRLTDENAALETRFDDETLQFHKRVRDGYLGMAAQEPERFRILDALQTTGALEEQTYLIVKHAMDARK